VATSNRQSKSTGFYAARTASVTRIIGQQSRLAPLMPLTAESQTPGQGILSHLSVLEN
jgi:hypothetical protein